MSRNVPKSVPVYCLDEQGIILEVGSSGDSDDYQMPDNMTIIAPPDVDDDSLAQFDFNSDSWNIIFKDPNLRLTAEERAESEKQKEISTLQKFLQRTDYTIIKISEGVSTTEDYSSIMTERQTSRMRLNELGV